MWFSASLSENPNWGYGLWVYKWLKEQGQPKWCFDCRLKSLGEAGFHKADIVYFDFKCSGWFGMIKYIYNYYMITYGGVWEEFLIRTIHSWLLNVFGKWSVCWAVHFVFAWDDMFCQFLKVLLLAYSVSAGVGLHIVLHAWFMKPLGFVQL